jgi:hypothetical protein
MFLDWDEVLLALQLVLMLAPQLPKVPPLQAPSEVEPRKLVPHSRHPLLLPYLEQHQRDMYPEQGVELEAWGLIVVKEQDLQDTLMQALGDIRIDPLTRIHFLIMMTKRRIESTKLSMNE